jgi:hypothetical protein
VINADHKAPARVNLTAGSVDAGSAGGIGGGELGESGGESGGLLLLMLSSLPHLLQKETDNAGKPATLAQRRSGQMILTLGSAV